MVECFISSTFEMTNPEDQIKYSKKSARNNLENARINSLTIENINLEGKDRFGRETTLCSSFLIIKKIPNTKGTQLI